MILKAVLFWIPMVFIAILNGIIRGAVYERPLGELPAHQISTFALIILFGVYIWFVIPFLSIQSAMGAIAVGLIWLGLTIVFEFIFGHYVAGHSWAKLFADYKIWEGRLWMLVLVWIAVAPYLMFKIR